MYNMNLRKDAYRKIPVPLPFYLLSVGRHSYREGEGEAPSGLVNTFVQIIWSVSGIGEVTLYDRRYILHPGDFFYYLPGEDHSYRAVSTNWNDCWLCFEGVRAADFMLSYGYPRHIRGAGKCPTDLFDRLAESVTRNDPFQMRMHISWIAELLALAGTPKDPVSNSESAVSECVRLIQSSFKTPLLDISFLCAKLGIHRATLSRAFHRKMHRTPGEYLLAVRAHHGMSLLRGTDLPVAEIARRSGVENLCRFSRLIKRITGVPPLRYRNEHRENCEAEPKNRPFV